MKTHYTPFRLGIGHFTPWLVALALPCALKGAVYVSAFASVTRPFPFSGPLTQDTGQLVGQTATTAAVSFDASGQNSSATVRARVGDLGVRVFAGSAGMTAGATAAGIARFSDDLHITSETLPFGTPVSLEFFMDLRGTTSFDTSLGFPSNTGLDSSIFLIGTVSGFSHIYHELHRQGRATDITGDTTFTVNSTVGATLTLVGTLDINVRSDFQMGPNSGLSDYLDSASFFATPDSSEVLIVSASGHDYSVPEPEHGALAVGAALGLFGVWRRCRCAPASRIL